MEVINFFENANAWNQDDLFYPLRRYFGAYEGNPYNGKSNAEIKAAFLNAIHAEPNPSYDRGRIEELAQSLVREGSRFELDFHELLPSDFKVLLFPMKPTWDFVMKHLDGTWGVTFPTCIVLGAHPDGDLKRLRRTLHHEANHSIRLQFIKDDHCFLDRIILEGLAEAYVDDKFPTDAPSKYVSATTWTDVQTWLPKLKEFWLNDKFTFDDYKNFLYGSDNLGIPRWLGYAAGYHLVKNARRTSFQNMPWKKLVGVPASDFV